MARARANAVAEDDCDKAPLLKPAEQCYDICKVYCLHGNSSTKSDRVAFKQLFTLAYYAIASMGAQYFVKFLFTGYGFSFPLTVALFQVVCTVPVAFFSMKDAMDWATAAKCLPLAIIHMLNMTAALAGTCGLSLPMFIALRRCCMLFTIALERCLLGRAHKKAAVASTGLMIAGATLAAATDLDFSASGYVAIAANNLMTALYLVMIKRPKLASVDSKTILFYSSALAIPLLAVVAVAMSEPTRVRSFQGASAPGFVTVFALAGCMGVFINHATMVCTRTNGALTTSVVGSAKNIIMTAIGMLAFNDFVFSPWNMAGLVTSACGTVWYTLSEVGSEKRQDNERKITDIPTRQK